MISQSRLQEFGFSAPENFPQRLLQHGVTLTLPTAMERGLAPVEVVIEEGLLVPLQTSGSGSGMIIRNDGTMLYVAHRDAQNYSSPLESRFIREIPEEIRSSLNNVMRRAVQADPSLAELWQRIIATWTEWFPLPDATALPAPSGEFFDIGAAWRGVDKLLSQEIGRAKSHREELARLRLRVILQEEVEFQRGWQGEEIVVDEISFTTIERQGQVKYLMQRLFFRMQKSLQSPVFASGSHFRIYETSSAAYTLRLVVLPPPEDVVKAQQTTGIDLTLDIIDGIDSPEE